MEGPRRTETGEAPGIQARGWEYSTDEQRRAPGCIARRMQRALHHGSQGRTDVVTLPNGDRITGEVVRLDRGRLEFKTDDAGTLYLEWDKVATVQATRAVEVVTQDGRRILGSLGPAASRTLTVVGEAERVSVAMAEVTIIRQIGSSFWSKLDGSYRCRLQLHALERRRPAQRQLGHVLSHPRGARAPDRSP